MRDRNGGPKGPKGPGFRGDGPSGPRKPGGFGGKPGGKPGGFRSREGGEQRRDGGTEARGDGPKRPYFKASAPGAERPRREEGDRPFRERPPGRDGGGRDSGRDFGRRDARGAGAPGRNFSGKRGTDDKPAPDFRPYPGRVPERRETRGGEGHFSSESRNRAEKSSFGDKKSFGDKPRFAKGEGRGDAPRGDRGGDRGGDRFGDRSAPRGGGRFAPSADAPMRRTDALPDLRSESEIEGFRSDRIAKVIARAGLASRRDAEGMIADGRVAVNGVVIASPALDVSAKDRITVDGEPLPARDRTRLWFYHKPRGLVTTARDPEGRDTVFDNLPEDLPRVIAVGRLDINTEGLLLLTNDGGLARVLELPATGWVRRYRVRAFGEVNQARLDTLRDGLEIDGEQFGPVIATFERQQGANVWLTVDLREGKNREVKRVLEHLGLSVNRLIRISFGPFQLEDLGEGEVREIKSRVLKDQLGPSLMAEAGVDFESDRPASAMRERGSPDRGARAGGFANETGRDTGDRSLPGERPGKRPYSKDEDATPRRRNSWRDDDTERQARRSGAPRRGQDPRMERAERADKDGVVRARAASITDPAGRKIKVERVTGPAAEPARELRRPFLRDRGALRTDDAEALRDPSRRPNRERWKTEAAEGETPAREAAPRRAWQERPPREERPRGDRPYGDRPPRGDRPQGDRPPRREWQDRPPRGDRPQGDRPPRRDGTPRGDRPFGDRPPRGDRPQGDRPPRREWQDRPPRGDKPYGDRPPRGDRPQGDRPPRRDGAPGGKGRSGKGTSGKGGFGGKPGGGRPGGGRPGGGKPGGRPGGGSSGGFKPRGRG